MKRQKKKTAAQKSADRQMRKMHTQYKDITNDIRQELDAYQKQVNDMAAKLRLFRDIAVVCGYSTNEEELVATLTTPELVKAHNANVAELTFLVKRIEDLRVNGPQKVQNVVALMKSVRKNPGKFLEIFSGQFITSVTNFQADMMDLLIDFNNVISKHKEGMTAWINKHRPDLSYLIALTKDISSGMADDTEMIPTHPDDPLIAAKSDDLLFGQVLPSTPESNMHELVSETGN